MVKHEKSKERLECLRENYKIVLQKLWKKRDLETLLFLRVAYETGIRGNDILKMDMSCMKGRQILLAEGKRGLECLYQQLNGNYPKVSRQTLRVMEVLYKKQGKFSALHENIMCEKYIAFGNSHRFVFMIYGEVENCWKFTYWKSNGRPLMQQYTLQNGK